MTNQMARASVLTDWVMAVQDFVACKISVATLFQKTITIADQEAVLTTGTVETESFHKLVTNITTTGSDLGPELQKARFDKLLLESNVGFGLVSDRLEKLTEILLDSALQLGVIYSDQPPLWKRNVHKAIGARLGLMAPNPT